MPGFDITIDHASKKFDSFVALKDIDLKIEGGEFICIIGPAGCGKTVLLRLINGFERPTEGDIKFGDEIVNDVPPYRRGVPTVFQNFALFPHKKVYDNIEYGLKVQNAPLSERKQKVREVMEKLDILELGDRYPNQI
ncbi:MAG: ATP-binding cassette domain-containing protein, partial [Deltaproteobacteria bacterium]|nr:ATP-binding cassette domain-containing protein [Deltaproteobacteria bacterium]